jgi:hypothetical protein
MSLPLPAKIVLRDARWLLVRLDMCANFATGGQSGETISYRVAIAQRKGTRFGCAFCRFLDLFQKDHCAITLAADDKQRTVGS